MPLFLVFWSPQPTVMNTGKYPTLLSVLWHRKTWNNVQYATIRNYRSCQVHTRTITKFGKLTCISADLISKSPPVPFIKETLPTATQVANLTYLKAKLRHLTLEESAVYSSRSVLSMYMSKVTVRVWAIPDRIRQQVVICQRNKHHADSIHES